jgi:hypothetical protein
MAIDWAIVSPFQWRTGTCRVICLFPLYFLVWDFDFIRVFITGFGDRNTLFAFFKLYAHLSEGSGRLHCLPGHRIHKGRNDAGILYDNALQCRRLYLWKSSLICKISRIFFGVPRSQLPRRREEVGRVRLWLSGQSKPTWSINKITMLEFSWLQTFFLTWDIAPCHKTLKCFVWTKALIDIFLSDVQYEKGRIFWKIR